MKIKVKDPYRVRHTIYGMIAAGEIVYVGCTKRTISQRRHGLRLQFPELASVWSDLIFVPLAFAAGLRNGKRLETDTISRLKLRGWCQLNIVPSATLNYGPERLRKVWNIQYMFRRHPATQKAYVEALRYVVKRVRGRRNFTPKLEKLYGRLK